MCECQGNPLARVTLALGLPYLLVNRALIVSVLFATFVLWSPISKTVVWHFSKLIWTLFDLFFNFSLQLAWRHSRNLVPTPNPNPEIGRNRFGTMSQKCESNSVTCQALDETEQNLTPPPEGTVKILVPPPPHQENPEQEKFPRTEHFVGSSFWIQSCNIRFAWT